MTWPIPTARLRAGSSRLAEVKDANYRTEENPDSVTKVDNNHTYTYDANGNLVYVNTGRIKQDGALDSTAAERKAPLGRGEPPDGFR